MQLRTLGPLLIVGFAVDPSRAAIPSDSTLTSYTVAESLLCGVDFSPSSPQVNRSRIVSRLGAHLAWVEFARRGEHGMRVVRDCQLGPTFDDVVVNSLGFSADGNHLGYVARNGKEALVVVDGKTRPPVRVDEIGTVVFSRDLGRVLFMCRRGRSWHAVVDSTVSPPHKKLLERLFISRDGRRVAWIATDDGPRQLYLDGVVQPAWGNCADVIFSPDGSHVASVNWADHELQWRVIVDGKEHPICEQIMRDASFSPDGSRFAYSWGRGKKKWISVDGTPGPECDDLGGFEFSPDSKHLAYAAKHADSWTVVVDGQAGSAYQDFKFGSLVYSEDGAHLAFMARSGDKWQCFIDGVGGASYDDVDQWTFVFAPDGRGAAYGARQGGEWFMVVNGVRANKSYNWLTTAPTFNADGSVEYVGFRGGAYYRVKHVPVAGR